MPLTPGTRLGVYDVTAPIGEGGMGQVYRARDTKLNREVALKVLPDSFANDADRLARFTRETQTLASLNHPNIAHVHGLEKSSGVRALVMELIEGEDLSQPMGEGGAIPIDEALPIAKQIAEALEVAHEQGIIHRDLKPVNIKVRSDGTVKVWAFGVVLYEMLSGRRLFDAEDISETLAAVLTRDVSLTTLPIAIPARVRALLRDCLIRDPKQRLRDIGEARRVLDNIIAGAPDDGVAPLAVPATHSTSAAARALPWALVAALADRSTGKQEPL